MRERVGFRERERERRGKSRERIEKMVEELFWFYKPYYFARRIFDWSRKVLNFFFLKFPLPIFCVRPNF